MMKALPPNNRNDNLYQYLKIHADNIFSQTYNMQKNIPTLVSADESYFEFLPNILDNYNISLPFNLETNTIRDFIKYIPIMLKKKGTYTSLINV